jgi:O-antigen ligase
MLPKIIIRIRRHLADMADWLVVAIAAALPWSTSATAILIALWFATVLPTLDFPAVYEECRKPGATRPVLAAALSVLLVLWAGLALLWADAIWAERFAAFARFGKLLALPLLLVQFHRSHRGAWVLLAFLISCTVLLLTSYFLAFWPGLTWRGLRGGHAVPVKDYILQSEEFVLCAFGLLAIGLSWLRKSLWAALGLFLLAGLFLANVVYVVTSRTALVVAGVLLIVFAFHQFHWTRACAFLVAAILCGVAVWGSSPYLRVTTRLIPAELQGDAGDDPGRIGARIEFWKKSIALISEAPVFGHGTGSIRELFSRSTPAGKGATRSAADNPHNETLVVAIQMGLIGVGLLCAMWVAHLLLFAASGAIAWLGLAIVLQNIVSCLFNSHLTDFTQGWLYIFGVGVTAGYLQGWRIGTPGSHDRST